MAGTENDHEKARRAVAKALRNGTLSKSPCEICGIDDDRVLEAHHHLGYDEVHWLDVQWLCVRCHAKVDAVRARWAGSKNRKVLAIENYDRRMAEKRRYVQRLWESLPPEPWDFSDRRITDIIDELAYWGEVLDDGNEEGLPSQLHNYERFMDTHPEVYDGAEGFVAPNPWDTDLDLDE